MTYRRQIRSHALTTCIWVLLSFGSYYFHETFDAAIFLWMPAGFTVAAFHLTRRRQWPVLVAMLFPVQILFALMIGYQPIDSVAYASAALAQAVIASSLGISALGGRGKTPQRFRSVLGLFGAAIVGCIVGALIVMPFRIEQTLQEFAWWFLANVTGILTMKPMFMRAHQAITRKDPATATDWAAMIAAAIAFGSLSGWILSYGSIVFTPLLFGALVFIAFRLGHQASAAAVFAFATAATLLSIDGQSPASAFDLAGRDAVVTVQSWMLLMLGMALPAAAAILKRDGLQAQLLDQNSKLHENVMLLNLSEDLAGLGRWRIDLEGGTQHWSPRMLEMMGLPRETAPRSTKIGPLLSESGRPLLHRIARNRQAREPFGFDHTFKPATGPERVLRLVVLNEFDQNGRRNAVFGVAIDVTQQVHRERDLELARERAVRLAAEAQKLANTDALTDLPNRRHTFDRFESMVASAQKKGSGLSAIMFDIDCFKSINDTYGHPVGDQVIMQVADLARRQAREGDIIGRIGGEEFVWLLTMQDEPSVRGLAERLRASVEGGIKGSSLPNVTISIGLAQLRPGDTADGLLARADAALYKAKACGRNQVRRAA